CESKKIGRLAKPGLFECSSCSYQFTVTAGTIFHDSHLPLTKWFLATYIITESKKGISANQLKRMLAVSYKTAWYLCHRIRKAMQDESAELLDGIVKADETWVGGKARNMHKADKERRGIGGRGDRDHMTMVLGAVARGGDIRLKVDKRADSATLRAFLGAVVADNGEAIMTDEWSGYNGIEDEDTRHETVAHRSDEWVHGDVHTNTVEGVWSLFKRSIVGSYHQLSAKHLQAYLDEMAFRFNNRENRYLFRDTLLRLIEADTMPYKQLITA
ncbi:MAG: IS1595 family transposase, partial [Chloroflexota bacterium]